MASRKHKYIFYVYPSENEKHGRFFFSWETVSVKKRLRDLGFKFDFKKIY